MTYNLSNNTFFLMVISFFVSFSGFTQEKKSNAQTETAKDSIDKENYQLILNGLYEPDDNSANNSGVSYALNREKFQLFTKYAFIYDPYEPKGDFKIKTSGTEERYSSKTRHIYRHHGAVANLSFTIGENDKISLNNLFSYTDDNDDETTKQANYKRKLNRKEKTNLSKFSQVWQHLFNRSSQLEIGGIETFQQSKFSGTTHHVENFQQNLTGDITSITGFANFKNKNKFGKTTAGLQYENNTTTQNNKNNLSGNYNTSTHHYKEGILRALITHYLSINETSDLDIGLSLENSFTENTLPNNSTNELFKKNRDFNNLLYHLNYNWRISKENSFQLGFQKTIERPRFEQLNPFKKLFDNHTFYVGRPFLKPEKNYTLRFQNNRRNWQYYLQTGYNQDYITGFFTAEEEQVLYTFDNLSERYFVGGGIEFSQDFFNHIWEASVSGDFNYASIKDHRYELKKPWPDIGLKTNQRINFGNHWQFEMNYLFHPTTQNGLVKRHNYSKLDVTLHKKINDRLSVFIYAEDIFKTNRKWVENTLPGFEYAANIDIDLYAYGISLQYKITGKSYKKHHNPQPKNSSSKRL